MFLGSQRKESEDQYLPMSELSSSILKINFVSGVAASAHR